MTKILLVEDDLNLGEIYKARLEAEGFQVLVAKDGEEGLMVAKANQPDLLISDVMMPRVSGMEMLEIIKSSANLKNMKVIMLTALNQNTDEERAKDLGADKYLVKSQVTLEDIVTAVHELLSESSAAAPAPEMPTMETPSSPMPTDMNAAPEMPTTDMNAAPTDQEEVLPNYSNQSVPMNDMSARSAPMPSYRIPTNVINDINPPTPPSPSV